jgi:hypothetical protein
MDVLGFFRSDLSLAAIVAGIIILIITGRLIPWWTVKRELAAARQEAEDWKRAHGRSEDARSVLMQQNSHLLAGVRIADKFYGDFIPAIDENTQPSVRGSDVPT